MKFFGYVRFFWFGFLKIVILVRIISVLVNDVDWFIRLFMFGGFLFVVFG